MRLPPDGVKTKYRAVNTAPLILQGAGGVQAIALGDVNGEMYFYSAEDLRPLDEWKDLPSGASLKVEDSGIIAYPLSLLRSGETAARAPYTYSQRTGVGTDPLMANRLLMTGVNYTAPGSTAVRHRLVAYHNPAPYNLSWDSAALSPQRQIDAGETVTPSGAVRLKADLLGTGKRLSQIRKGDVHVRWFRISTADLAALEGANWAASATPSLQEIPDPSRLPADMVDGSVTNARNPFTASDQFPTEGTIIGVIDIQKVAQYAPGSLGARIAAKAGIRAGNEPSDHYELNYDDNAAKLPYRLRTPLNLSIVTYAFDRQDHLEINAYVTNSSAGRIDGSVPVGGTVTSSAAGTFTLPVRRTSVGPGSTETITWGLPLNDCDRETFDISVQVNLNPTEANRETTYGDNTAQRSVTAGVPGCPAGIFAGGERRVIIVPPDCVVVTDPDDRKLCEQYRKSLD